MRSLLFGDYMKPDAVSVMIMVYEQCSQGMLLQDPRLYEEVGSIEEMTEVVTSGLEEYNNTHKNRMNLVVFR